MSNKTKAFFLAFGAVIAWSTIGSAFKITLQYLDPVELELFSIPVAIAITALSLTIHGNWNLVWKSTGKEFLVSAILGILNPFVYYIVVLYAYDLLLTQEATTLNFTWPIVLVFFSAFVLKQKLTFTSFLALLLGFAGTCIIATKGSLTTLKITNTTGMILALGSTLAWALFWVFNKKDKRIAEVKLFLNFSFAMPFTLITWLIFYKPVLPPLKGLLGAFYIGAFELGITFLLWLQALSYAKKTSEVANLIYLTPFFALFWIHIVVGESIHPSTVAGLVLIVGGILLQGKAQKKTPIGGTAP